jgi:beta-lactamase class A
MDIGDGGNADHASILPRVEGAALRSEGAGLASGGASGCTFAASGVKEEERAPHCRVRCSSVLTPTSIGYAAQSLLHITDIRLVAGGQRDDQSVSAKEALLDVHRSDELLWRGALATSRRGALRALAAGVAVTTFAPSSLHAQEATPGAVDGDWSAVEALAHDAEDTGGVVGVAIHGAEGELFSRQGDRRFRAASTIKVPIMIEAYREIERGALALDDRYSLRDEDRIPGSGVLSHLHEGLELTFADLLSLMIAVSDNTATNLVLDQIGLETVNATMQSLGMKNSILGRRILGHLPKAGDPENWATPRDFARAIHAIIANEAAEPESCAQMLATLELQGEIRRISRFVPAEPNVRWGTKPGDLPGVINDAGFVSSDRGTLSMAVFCENLPDLDAAERTIGLIAREALSVTGIVSFARE